MANGLREASGANLDQHLERGHQSPGGGASDFPTELQSLRANAA